MLYAKVIYTGMEDHSSASDRQTVVQGERFDFEVVKADTTKAWMIIHTGKEIERLELTGDVWVMNEAGKTISQFAVPLSILEANKRQAQ